MPDELKRLEQELERIQQQLTDLLLVIPNLPHEIGAGGRARPTTTSRCGESASRARFDFPVKDHVDVGEGLGLLDFERASKICAARASR